MWADSVSPLDTNDNISTTIGQIILYPLSNKIAQCQLYGTKDTVSISSIVKTWKDIKDKSSKENTQYIF